MENRGMQQDVTNLNVAEIFIRRNTALADASPFLAHCGLSDADKVRFSRSFTTFIHADAARIPEAFRRWPLTSVWNFANALSASYGEDDHAVYRVLDVAFGVSIAGGTRTQISEAFRPICRRFGLCYEGSLRRVNDYLAQAGIANTQLHYVAKAFLLAERAFGPAPVDNTASLNSWEDDATYFLPPGLSIPRMVLEVDETAHYAFLFTRFRQDEQPRNSFERLFFDEIKKAQEAISAGQYRSQAVPKPSLVWGQGGLALALPKLEGRLTISLAGETRKLRGGQNWPLPTPWPDHIDWSFDGPVERIAVFPTRRHLLAFDHESGRLITAIDPAQGKDLAVDGREIVLVAASPFSVGGEVAFPIGCDGHARHCVLGPSTVLVQTNSGAVKLRAKPKPRIWIEDGAVAKGPKGYLLASSAAFAIEFGDIAGEAFDLALSVGDRQEVIPLTGEPGTNFLTYQLPDYPAIAQVLMPVKAELRLRGSQRALVRYKAWLWPGLQGLTDGIVLESGTVPDNYCAERSRHIAADRAGRLCLDTDAAYEAATLSFNVGNERIEFEIPRPGISLFFIDVEGRSVPLKLGEPLIILNEDKGGSLVVRSPDRLAALNVRGRVEQQAFRQSATRVLSLADLIAPAPRDDVTLAGSTGIPILLTRIVPALAPQTFAPQARSQGLSLNLRMPSAIDALRLSLEDETGIRAEFDCALTHHEVPNPTPSWFHAELDAADTHRILVRLNLTDFQGDLSLARVLVRPAGNDTFRPLRNLRGDNYALILKPSGQDALAHPTDGPDLQKRFVTVNSWMQLCFSRESWDFIGSHIEPRWMALGKAVAATAEGSAQLLSGAYLPRLPGNARS
jgi:hypothetical protein